MSDTDINATVNVTEDIYADVDSTAMSAAVIDDGDSIVVPAEVDFGQTLDTELEDNDLIDVPVDESVGIAGDHRVLLHRDAANQHPMSAITGLNETIAGINTALSDRITQVEAETADLDVDMASALLRIGDLQDQVDGNITTWFYAAEPAMNLPPVALDPSNPHDTGWDTIDKKNAHRGDLYYNTLTGYAYRFAYADGDFGWMRITDTDVVKALADAARAQDTADSKRRVFYTTPYPPYDKGDLWVQGTSGDILVCNTSKAAGEAYDFADWAKASKYTDDTVADIALASANGKNTVYHQASQPTGGTYKKGDTWFDTDDDYTMYTYDGSLWVKEQFGNEAIADLSITNGKIANATIEYGKIKSVDAGKITVGDLSANRIKASVITAVNNSTETSGGSSLKISADKVNIEGAAIFTSGRLSTTSLDNAYDANGAATGALADAKDYADGTAADALADAKTYADGAVSDKAGKSDAVARQQRIYYRKTASGAPSKNTTWLTTSGTGYGNWSLKIPQMTSGTTKYPYLYTAVQTQTVSQMGGTTCSCSDVLLDDTTTVIDGGTIITGSLNANRIGAGDISADRMKVNSISAINGNTGTVKISAGKVEIDGATTFNAIKSQTDAAYDSKGSASAVQTNLNNLEIGGRNLLLDTSTADTWTISLNSSNFQAHDCYKTYMPVPSIFEADDLVTISFDWSTTGTSGSFNLECGKVTPYTWGTVVNAIGTRSATSRYIDITSSNTSGHAVITFKITNSQASAATTLEWFRIRVDGTDMANKTFTISNAKAERGNKATDWTPAPEDVQAEIDGKTASWVLKSGNASGASYSTILGYAAEGTQTTFTIDSSTPTTGIKAGDTVRLAYLANNMGTNGTIVYIVGTVKTTPASTTSITLIGHGLDTTVIDGGHILTGTIDANRIGANSITLGKIDSRLQRSLNWYATCDTAAATTAKVATISPATTEFTLSEGVSVNVKFTNTNSGAVGSITLNVNNTGAKNIKYINNTAISNIPSAGYIVSGVTYQFVYDGTYWVIQNLNYNTNDVDRKRINNAVIVAENITQYCIAGRSAEQNVTGHKKLVANLVIDLTFPICYLNQANASGQSYAVASGSTTTNFYTAYPSVNLQNTKTSWTGTNRAVCYIKGTLTGQKFKVHSDVFTTSIPSNNDGFAYIPIGVMYSTYQVNFACDNTVYAFRNGSFHKIDTVSDYVTQIDENGIWITPADLKPTNTSTGAGATGTKIDADGLDIYQEGTSVAHYGDYARVGKDGEANTRISPNEVIISASDDISALRITPDGNTQALWYRGYIHKKLLAGESYTYTHPSGADSNSKITYLIRSKAGSKKTITVTKGQTTSATTVATPFKFKYSATTSALTITNNESSQYIILYEVTYRKTSTSPLIEAGGVITLGQYPDVGSSTRLVVGNGTADTAVSNAFEVDSYGNVYANGSLYTNGGSTEISKGTVVFGQKNDGTAQGYIFQWKSGNVTSNSSGLINLSSAFGIDYNNAAGITVNCVTSNYKVSGVTAWNGYWYGILSQFNSAAVVPNTTVNLVVSWFRGIT